MATLFQLFASFLVIGATAYGGGIATISLIQREIVAAHGWLTAAQMRELITLAQMTPGPIAINAATFTGYRVAGIAGSLVSTLAVITPGVLLLSGYSLLLSRFRPTGFLDRAREALRPGILALILYAVYTFGATAIDGLATGAIAAGTFLVILLCGRRVHPALLVFAAGGLGVLLFRS